MQILNQIYKSTGFKNLYDGVSDCYKGNFKNGSITIAKGIAQGTLAAGSVALMVHLSQEVFKATHQTVLQNYQNDLNRITPKTAKIEIFCQQAGGSEKPVTDNLNKRVCRKSMAWEYEKDHCEYGFGTFFKEPDRHLPDNVADHITQSIEYSIFAGKEIKKYCEEQNLPFDKCYLSMVAASNVAEQNIKNYCEDSPDSCRKDEYSLNEISKSPLHRLMPSPT